MSYAQYQLGTMTEFQKKVKDLNKMKNLKIKYEFKKSEEKKKGLSFWILQVDKESCDYLDCGIVLVKDDEVYAVGEDVYNFVEEVFSGLKEKKSVKKKRR